MRTAPPHKVLPYTYLMTTPIVTEKNPILRNRANEVPTSLFKTGELYAILAKMSASLRATHNGVAIAAPQIGIPYRIFVVSGFVIAERERNFDDPDVAFINPKILRLSRERETMEEGCLSVPGFYGQIIRASKAKIRAYTPEGKKFERGGSGLLAQIFQHEVDHLNGVLFIDKATNVVRVEEGAPTTHSTPLPPPSSTQK